MCSRDTWPCSVIGPLCEAVNSRRLGDAFVVPANSALRLRSLTRFSFHNSSYKDYHIEIPSIGLVLVDLVDLYIGASG